MWSIDNGRTDYLDYRNNAAKRLGAVPNRSESLRPRPRNFHDRLKFHDDCRAGYAELNLAEEDVS